MIPWHVFLAQKRILVKFLTWFQRAFCLCTSSSLGERRPSSSRVELRPSQCCKGGCLVLYRAERVLGRACQHQSQLSGRSEMAERGGSVQQQLHGPSGYSFLRFSIQEQRLRFCFSVGSSPGNKRGRSLNQQPEEVENLNVFLLRCFVF